MSVKNNSIDELKLKRKKLFEIARKYRAQLEEKYEENERFYNGDQWKLGQKRNVKNFCFSIVEQEVAILTESRPGTSIVPLQSEDEDNAKVLESALQSVYDSQRLNIKMSQGIREALISGPSWLWVDYNHDLENGLGNVIIRNIPWRLFWIDPGADEVDQADFAFLKIPVSVETAKRLYPKAKDKIRPIRPSATESKAENGKNPNVHRSYDPVNPDVSRFDSENNTELEEFWFKDYSEIKIPEEDTLKEIEKETNELQNLVNPDVGKYENHEKHIIEHRAMIKQMAGTMLQLPGPASENEVELLAQNDEKFQITYLLTKDHIEMHKILYEENPKAMKPKYKNFLRRTVWCGNELIEDAEPEVQDGMIPIVPIYAYKVLNSIYGQGELKNIIPSQKVYNDIDFAEYKALRLNANSGWILDSNSGVNEKSLTNKEGIIIKKTQGTEVNRIQPGTVSPQYQTRKIDEQRTLETISGINEITQGRRPTGITAAQALQTMRESSVTRIRQKTRNIEEYTMLRLGQLCAARIIKYWSVERKLRIYDKNGQLIYVDFDPAKIQELKYDVRITPGTTAGIDKEAIFVLMKDLLVSGAINKKTFFKVVDIPYKADILRDIEEEDEMTQQLQQVMEENEQLKLDLGQVEQEIVGEESSLQQGQQLAMQ